MWQRAAGLWLQPFCGEWVVDAEDGGDERRRGQRCYRCCKGAAEYLPRVGRAGTCACAVSLKSGDVVASSEELDVWQKKKSSVDSVSWRGVVFIVWANTLCFHLLMAQAEY